MSITLVQKYRYKIIIAGIGVVLIALFGYSKMTANHGETRYMLIAAETGTLISSISGTGQVAALSSVELKPRASGDIIYLNVKEGQEVKTGTLLASINAKEALKSVRDAEASLESAKLSMEKLLKPADALSITQAENSLESAKLSKSSAQESLAKAYEDSFNAVANAFLELPNIISGLDSILHESAINPNQDNANYYHDSANMACDYSGEPLKYKSSAEISYVKARESYEQNFANYKTANRLSDAATLESLLTETYATTRDMAEAAKSINNFIQFYKDKLTEKKMSRTTLADSHLSTLNGYTSKTNSHLSSLLSAKNSISGYHQSIENYTRTIDEKTQSLADLRAGADPFDIKSQELSLKQKENSLRDAKEKLADYSIRAPFAGIVANVAVAKGDTVSSGTTLATLITKQKMAVISLNEIDAAKVKVGQKTMLTFDALDGLNMAGEVVYVDALGAVSQGVVSYTIKIAFDSQDERIKPNMSVAASIILNTKTDVLLIPNSALKSIGEIYYVERPDEEITASQSGVTLTLPSKQQPVEIGSANDTSTEIVSGLAAGDLVISRTITPTTTASSTSSTNNRNNFRMLGM